MLYVPAGVERRVPEWFTQALHALDPNLLVYFNPRRGRWIVDRCTRGGALNAAAHEHTPQCPKTNVTVVQEDGGGYMPLCQQVLDDLKAKDAWSQHGSLEQYQTVNRNAETEEAARRSDAVDALYKEASADNRRQLMKAYHLTQQHDTARVNQ